MKSWEVLDKRGKSSERMTSLSIKEGHLSSYYTIGTIELIGVIGLVKEDLGEIESLLSAQTQTRTHAQS